MPKPLNRPSIAIRRTATDEEDAIRRLACELYEERGRADGHDLDDWLQAETEIRGTASRTTAA